MPGESGDAATWGKRAELAAARKYGLRRVGRRWYDAVHISNGSKVQIKAARVELRGGQTGVFRVWRNDHINLKRARGSYVFVLYNPENTVRPILRIEKISPSTVDELVSTWGPSNHHGRRKHLQGQIPWTDVFDGAR